MKRLYLPIFWKFLIAIILTVSLFGLLNIILVWDKVFETIDNEISKRIIYIGKNLANQSSQFILYKDIASLQSLTEDTKKSDSVIVYCFILDKNNQVLAHTFQDGFPKNLINANNYNPGDSISVVSIIAENFQSKDIKDILIPVLDGKVGFVRIGINHAKTWYDMKFTLISFIIIFFIFTLLGFFGAFIFSYIISKPIKEIKQATEIIDINNLNKIAMKSINEGKNSFLLKLKIEDEIDDLAYKFNDMIRRLESTYQQLMITQNAMIQAEKLASIGTLVSGIAHEVNNPLSGLQSCIRRIAEHPDNVEQNIRYIRIMEEASNKIQNVIAGLLDFSRITHSKKEHFDIIKIIDDTINLISYRKTFNPIEIVFNKNYDVLYLECNKNQMEQVFFNLLKNAFDGIEEKFRIDDKLIGRIEISVKNKNSIVEITIKDNGIGIRKENLNKIFDPFFTTKDVGKGTGLGGYISYNIIKDHGWDMFVESEYLQWTKVILSIKN
ncbi:sensor histidine kinase [Bacteroidetes/Chlorobi group bacterium ChocPot_Mid]|jgi:two-component system NtrC family sensor kinase|nr:MAG: sensor histidine kinase [Bacteroidetes/Chlorobi group bacterium ChocPot_Mid]